MKNNKIDIKKITDYLKTVKSKKNYPKLYNWKVELSSLEGKSFITDDEFNKIISCDNALKRDLTIQKILSKHLSSCKNEYFNEICLWIIKDWGGIRAGNEKDTITKTKDFLTSNKFNFNRIASTSKVAAFKNPQEHFIYDSRVAYSINWILLSQNASSLFFPLPEGRNSFMSAFDMGTLIRLKYKEQYLLKEEDINNVIAKTKTKIIFNRDESLFIEKSKAYIELRNLIKEVSKELWDTPEEQNNLFYTELLLFSISDNYIFNDIIMKYSI